MNFCKNPEIVAFHQYVVSPMKSHMQSNGFAMKDSTRKFIRNNLEKNARRLTLLTITTTFTFI